MSEVCTRAGYLSIGKKKTEAREGGRGRHGTEPGEGLHERFRQAESISYEGTWLDQESERPPTLWRTAVGWSLVCIGVLGIILPVIPGLPLLAAGLLVLSARYRWATISVRWVRRKVRQVAARRGGRKRSPSGFNDGRAGNTWKEPARLTKIDCMSSRSIFRIAALFLIIASTLFAGQQDRRGRKYKAPPER